MVDTSKKLDKVIELIERGKYFTINRPRQYGKTTTLLLLENRLKKLDYLPISISFEGVDETGFAHETRLAEEVVKQMVSVFKFTDNFIKVKTHLDYEKILIKFQEYMREQYSKKDERKTARSLMVKRSTWSGCKS